MKTNNSLILGNINFGPNIPNKSLAIYTEENNNMKIVLTGASGFLGQYVYKELLKYGYDIISIRNKLPVLGKEIVVDLATSSSEELLNICEGANVIIHMASVVDFSDSLNKQMFKVNTLSSIRLARVAKALKAHYIFISSSFIHGKEEIYISDKSDNNPDLPYSLSKWLADEIISELYDKVSILRICGIFGLNGPKHLGINKAITRAFYESQVPNVCGRGTGKRNYIYVQDVAKIISFVVDKCRLGKMYVAGKKVLSIKEMAELICEVFISGSSPKFLEGKDTKDQIVNSSEGLPEILTFQEALEDIKNYQN